MKPLINYDDFAKLDLRIARVIKAEEIDGADKLLKITLDVGEVGERTVAAGIKEWYKPEDLEGKTIVYLANLEPKMIRGVKSEGMIMAAGEDTAVLIQPDKEIETGEIVR